MNATRQPPGGRSGSRTTLTKDDVSEILDSSDDAIQTKLPLGKPTATVGMSVSAGMNTEFGREKIEVSAWCTLPCLTDPRSIERTYQQCYDLALYQAKTRLDQAAREFFPELYPEEANEE